MDGVERSTRLGTEGTARDGEGKSTVAQMEKSTMPRRREEEAARVGVGEEGAEVVLAMPMLVSAQHTVRLFSFHMFSLLTASVLALLLVRNLS